MTPGQSGRPADERPSVRQLAMDSNTHSVIDFLSAMRPVHEALDGVLRQLYKRPEVRLVHTHVMEAKPSPDFGLSADLRNGAVIDFWLWLSFERSFWQLEYAVYRHDPGEDGSHPVTVFPRQDIHSVQDMPSILIEAIKDLERASADDALFI
jgi:hypothetical protein